MTEAGPVLVIAKSAELTTVESAVELSLAGLLSVVALDATAVFVIVVPSVVPALTCTTSVNIALAPAANEPMTAVNVPVPPTGGVGGVGRGNAGAEGCWGGKNVGISRKR